MTARFWFKLREPSNWAISVILFIPLNFVLMTILGGLLAALVSIAIVFSLFFFVLEKRAIGIDCSNEKCGKHIETNTPWICGDKGCRNEQVDDFPFIHRCQHCGYVPKAYKCHHCGQLIFFTEDRQKTGYAVCANDSFKPTRVKKRRKHEDALVEKKEKIELKGLSVEEAKLDVELKKHEDALKPVGLKVKSAEQELEEFMNSATEDEDAAEKWRKFVDEKYKDDPYERERRHALIKSWMTRRMK